MEHCTVMKKDSVPRKKTKKLNLIIIYPHHFLLSAFFLRLIALLAHYQTQINQQDINEIKTALESFSVQAS